MKTIILITGKQNTGKTMIANIIKKSKEVHDLKDAELATKRQPYKKTSIKNIVVTSNDVLNYNSLKISLIKLAKNSNREFLNFNAV